MAFNPDHLLKRSLVIDRARDIVFFRLHMTEAVSDALLPAMLKLANIENSSATYLLPLVWIEDAVLLKKLAKNTLLLTLPSGLGMPLAAEAREAGYRIAVETANLNAVPSPADFYLISQANIDHLTANIVLTNVDSVSDFDAAHDAGGTLFDGRSPFDRPALVKPAIHPGHATVLELINAVQQEAEPKDIEALFKKDVTLSFKLLRYINSPFFGLTTRVESVRHALAVIGYQQLFKWLSLLAATAGSGAAPALTHSAMIRARFMELLGARLDKRDQDYLFITGMFSLLDRIMQVPMEQLLERAKLPEAVTRALLANEGRYGQILSLVRLCDGEIQPGEETSAEIDPKTANLAHIEAIEWAMQVAKAQ